MLISSRQFVIDLLASTQITEADKIAKALISVFECHNQVIELIKTSLESEVDSAVEANALLRANSFASKIMKEYCNVVGKSYLRQVLGEHIQELCINPNEGGASFEVDSSKMKERENLENNQAKLLKTCDTILNSVFSNAENLPPEIRLICYWTKTLVATKFESFTQASVGGFIFLRYICPAVVAPTAASILTNPPSSEAQRGLTLIAKVLQNISNRVSFGKKEDYLTFTNDFVEKSFQPISE